MDKHRNWTWTRSYSYDAEAAVRAGQSAPTPEEWMARMREFFTAVNVGMRWIALVFHDKDVVIDPATNTTVNKGLHMHGVGASLSPMTQSAAIKRFLVTRDENCTFVKDKKHLTSALLYLTHSTEQARKAHKFEYGIEDVVVSVAPGAEFSYREARFGNIPSQDAEDKENKIEERSRIARGLIEGTLSLDDAMRVYADDSGPFDMAEWQSHRPQYRASVDEYVERMGAYYADPRHMRCLTNVFITAPGEHRKTDLALGAAAVVADKRGVHLVAAKGKDTSFDFADGYNGGTVTVVNEASGGVFAPDQFCSLFDGKHASIANSRNKDKPWFAEWTFWTSSKSVESFLWEMYVPYAKELIRGAPAHLSGNAAISEEAAARDGMSEAQAAAVACAWRHHYLSNPEVADKVCQMRRRFALWVRQSPDNGEYMEVLVRNPACNPAAAYVAEGAIELNNIIRDAYVSHDWSRTPWRVFRVLSNRSEADLPNLVAAIFAATRFYYELTGYSVNPWSTARPESLPIN